MNIVIEGAGDVGSHLAKMLRADGNDITVIDNDAARLASLSSYVDAETVLGRPSTIKSLKKAGVDKADLHIAVCPYVDQEVNLMGALLAKRLGAKCVVARINHEHCLSRENRALLKEMGVDHMIYPERLAADEIIDSLNHNLSNDNMDFAHGKLKISVFKLDEASAMLDLRLSEFVEKIGAEDLLKFRIIAISRGGTTLIPKMDTKFRFGDMLFVISTVEGDDCLKRYFGQNWIKTEKVMIMGGTPMAKMLARDLDAQGVEVKIIDKDKDKCITLSEKLPDSVMVVNIDGRNTDALYEEGIASYDTFIALTDNDESNILSCVAAEKMGVSSSIAEVENLEYIKLAEEFGVDHVINKKLITASRILKLTLSNRARFVRYMAGTNAEIMEYVVAQPCAVTKGPLKSIRFPDNVIVGGVIRGQETEIAVGDTRIYPGDRVVVFALGDSIKETDKLFR